MAQKYLNILGQIVAIKMMTGFFFKFQALPVEISGGKW